MLRRTRKITGVPVLKLPPSQLRSVLLALRAHEYDRDGFQRAVLELFTGKTAKSVFRGMAIPTLRGLGLLVGFEQEMRLSGDGELVAMAFVEPGTGENRPLQRLLCQLEVGHGLDIVWRTDSIDAAAAPRLFRRLEKESSQRTDFVSQVRRWLQYLEFFGVARRPNGKRLIRVIRVSSPEIQSGVTVPEFVRLLRDAYRHAAPQAIGEPVVAIEDLHRALAVKKWVRCRAIVLRADFDALLRKALTAGLVGAHLHRSMGAEQRLFEFQKVHYQAMSLQGTNHG